MSVLQHGASQLFTLFSMKLILKLSSSYEKRKLLKNNEQCPLKRDVQVFLRWLVFVYAKSVLLCAIKQCGLLSPEYEYSKHRWSYLQFRLWRKLGQMEGRTHNRPKKGQYYVKMQHQYSKGNNPLHKYL